MIALIIGILVALVVTLAGTPLLIRLVHRLHYGQYIRQDGPKSHLVKRGTPTMGGLIGHAGSVRHALHGLTGLH